MTDAQKGGEGGTRPASEASSAKFRREHETEERVKAGADHKGDGIRAWAGQVRPTSSRPGDVSRGQREGCGAGCENVEAG